jgi:hypothetical protein
MAFVTGLLDLGSALNGRGVVTPGAGLGYTSQIINYDIDDDGIGRNTADLIFGPVLGSGDAPWGTLSVFGLSDLGGTAVWSGPLTVPATPLPGQLIFIPVGQLQLITSGST